MINSVSQFISNSFNFIVWLSVWFLQFSDQLEGMIETMQNAAEQVERAEPISAHPDKLREQMADNQAIMEDLDRRMSALEAVKATADDLVSREGMDEEAAKGEWSS